MFLTIYVISLSNLPMKLPLNGGKSIRSFILLPALFCKVFLGLGKKKKKKSGQAALRKTEDLTTAIIRDLLEESIKED